MKTSVRRRLAAALFVAAVLAGVALYLSGVPMLTFEGSNSSSFPGGELISSSYTMHEPLLAVGLMVVAGLVVFFWPARQPPKLRE